MNQASSNGNKREENTVNDNEIIECLKDFKELYENNEILEEIGDKFCDLYEHWQEKIDSKLHNK